jgi:hypothetical protein
LPSVAAGVCLAPAPQPPPAQPGGRITGRWGSALPLKAADAHSCKLVSKHSGPRFGVSRPAAHWNALICRGQRGTLRGHPHVPRGGALADECVCSPHVPPRRLSRASWNLRWRSPA